MLFVGRFFVRGCPLFVVLVFCVLLIVCRALRTVRWLLCVAGCLPFVARCFGVCCLLFVGRCCFFFFLICPLLTSVRCLLFGVLCVPFGVYAS